MFNRGAALVTWRFATARAPGDYLAAPQLATGCKLGGRPRGRRSANIQPVVSWRWDPDLTWRRAVVTWGSGDAQAVVRGVARPLMGVLPLPRRRWLGVRVRYAFCVHERPQAFRPFRVFAVVAEPDPVLRVNAPRAFGILWSRCRSMACGRSSVEAALKCLLSAGRPGVGQCGRKRWLPSDSLLRSLGRAFGWCSRDRAPSRPFRCPPGRFSRYALRCYAGSRTRPWTGFQGSTVDDTGSARLSVLDAA